MTIYICLCIHAEAFVRHIEKRNTQTMQNLLFILFTAYLFEQCVCMGIERHDEYTAHLFRERLCSNIDIHYR